MLEHLIKKYKDNDIEGVVYRLSYGGKFIIVKGATLAGSLIIMSNTYKQYYSHKKRFQSHLYRFFFSHFMFTNKKNSRFHIKILAKISPTVDQYQLLKREQMELDRHKNNKLCLNNATEAYIPVFNDLTDKYGWLEKSAVMNFKRYLRSKQRAAYIKRYTQ